MTRTRSNRRDTDREEKGLRPLFALLLCFAVGGAGAGSTSTSIAVDNSVSSSTSTTSTTGSKSTAGATGTTTCSVNVNGRRCEATCPAPKVALCVKPSTDRTPRCSCQ